MSPITEPDPIRVSPDAAKRELRTLRLVVMSAAHQLNNVLSGLMGYADLEAEEADGPSPAFVQMVLEHSESGVQLAQALMNVAARSYGRKETVSPAEPLEDVLTVSAKYLANRNVTLQADWGELPTCTMDVGAVRQALLDVVLSAVAIMPMGGSLAADAKADDAFAHIQLTAQPVDRAAANEWFDLSTAEQIVAEHAGRFAADYPDDHTLRVSLSLPLPTEPE